jgi:hypothetical protein
MILLDVIVQLAFVDFFRSWPVQKSYFFFGSLQEGLHTINPYYSFNHRFLFALTFISDRLHMQSCMSLICIAKVTNTVYKMQDYKKEGKLVRSLSDF